MEQYKVSLVGAATNGNVGAGMMVEAVSTELPNSRIGLFSHYPRIDRETPRVENLEIFDGSPLAVFPKLFLLALLWRLLPPLRTFVEMRSKSIRFIANSKLCLDVSGISFSDGRLGPLIYNVAILLPFLLTRVPIVKLSQAIGPINNLPTRIAAGLLLRKCKWVFARGETSMKEASPYCSANSSIAPDLVYGLAPSGPYPLENHGPVLVIPSGVVMKKFDSVFGSGAYCELMASFCSELCKTRKIIILPFAVLPPQIRHNNDSELCANISKISGVPIVTPDSLEGYRKIVDEASLVVTGRFHGMISAVAGRTGCLVTSWGHKYSEAIPSNQPNIEFLAWRELTVDSMLKAVKKLEDSTRETVLEDLERMRTESKEQFNFVRNLLGG